MRVNKYLYYSLLIIILLTSSCSRKLTPVVIKGKSGREYDAAAFNYVYVEAIKQKFLGNSSDALKYFEQCIKIDPGSDATYYQMAQIIVANGNIEGGKSYLKKALAIDERNIWYLMMIAGIYYQEKNIDSAIVFYEKAIKYFPDKESLLLTLGNLYSENKRYDKANSVFNAFDNKYGVNESSTLASIRSLMAEKRYEEALLKAQMLLKQFPDDILYNGVLAEIYRGKGENDKAFDVYEKLIERNPDNPQIQLSLCVFLKEDKKFEELLMLLNTLIINSNVTREDKITLLNEFLEDQELVMLHGNSLLLSLMVMEANYKNDDIVVLLRPDLLVKVNKLVEAADRLNEIISEKPANYYAWEKLLLIYLQQRDFKNLLEKGEECATLFNTSFFAKVIYANGALECGKYDIALDELRKAEILAGDNKDFILQILTMRADIYYRMKDYEKSFRIFDEAIKLNNDDLTILNNYAYYLAEQNMKLKEAEDMARRVIEKEKNNTTFLDTYGWVLFKRGKLNEAAKIMEIVIGSKDKPSAEWFEHYGYILEKQNKCEKAIENWNTALKLDSTKTYLIKECDNCGK